MAAVGFVVLYGMKEVSRVKRVMMQVSLSGNLSEEMQKQLMQVPGVLEVTINDQSDSVYLKVDRDFDAVKARAVLNA